MIQERTWETVPGERQHTGARACLACHTETDPSYLAASSGCYWLSLAADMAAAATSNWRPSQGHALMACLPQTATRLPGADGESVRVARDFTIATLHRWGVADRCQDIAIVVSELLTNALRHALPAPTDTRPRWPIRLGLVQPGPWVLCAVADPSEAVPVPQTPGSLAETGRGLHIIRALSDNWGYTTPDHTGKVVWATFTHC